MKRTRVKVRTFYTVAERNGESLPYFDMGQSTTLLGPHGAQKLNFRSGYYKKIFLNLEILNKIKMIYQ